MLFQSPDSFSPNSPILETLEPRIAPATLINVGAPLNSSGVPEGDLSSYNYKYSPPDTPNPFQLAGGEGGVSVYSVKLATGKAPDAVSGLRLFNVGEAFQPWINIRGGSGTAFFSDFNKNDVVEANEFTGLSFTDKLGLVVDGSIYGDVVGTGGGNGQSTSLFATPGVSVASLKVSGSILGSVVAAGSINNVEIAGTVERISTASTAETAIKFNLGLGEQSLSPYIPAAGVAGGAINNVKIGEARILKLEPGADPDVPTVEPGIIQTGGGGSGAAGGSISRLTVIDDPDGLNIIAGNGGGGSRGGAGGSISQVVVYGAGETDALLPFPIRIEAGDGGGASAGGAGGNVSGVYIGYEPLGGKALQPSPLPSETPVVISAGDGGAGGKGGIGGAVKDIKILVSTRDRPDFHEIEITGGKGGSGTSNDGAGGSVTLVTAQNLFFNLAAPGLDHDSIRIQAGDAGEGDGEGANGGLASKLSLLADKVVVLAGAGSNGSARGGAGGAISVLELLYSQSDQVRFLEISGGDGGAASATGRAGAGGSVSRITANFVDLQFDATHTENVIQGGQGGSGLAAPDVSVGGQGGSLNNIRIFEPAKTRDDLDVVEDAALLKFVGGNGGNGVKSGGIGGAISDLTFFGYATTPSIQAGNGGNASAGAGGAGGFLRNVVLRSDWVLGKDGAVPEVAVLAGHGGNGLGGSGVGGLGGSATNVGVRVDGPLSSQRIVETYSGLSPETPRSITFPQFDSTANKASLVDVNLLVSGSVVGTFEAKNISAEATSRIVFNGASSALSAAFSGAQQPPETAQARNPTDLLLGYSNNGKIVLPPAALLPGDSEVFQTIALSNFDRPPADPVPQTLENLKVDLLSSQNNSEVFFSGNSQVNINLIQIFDPQVVYLEGAREEDFVSITGNLLAAGNVELTYGFMKWVNVRLEAGDGGDGNKSVGAGGSLSKAAAITSSGDGFMSAGDAGSPLAGSSRGAAGGAVTSAYLAASRDISILGGDGAAGGKGGSLSGVGWQKNTLDSKGNLDGVTAPLGMITLEAGQGSTLGKASGAGGGILNSAGFSSSNENASVRILAGDGNGPGGGAGSAGAAGGSISNVNIFGGTAPPEFVAGHGGKASAGAGGAGGSISSVSVSPGIDILQLAAGNGGDGTARGGLGGSVTKVNAFSDIGERSGKVFGFDTQTTEGAGGIFAGAGGNGSVKGKAGNVTDITAAAISSIVAGRPTSATAESVNLVNLVDRVYLRGLVAPTVEETPSGGFSKIPSPALLPSTAYPFGKPATVAFVTSNIVGSISGDPYAANANIFKTSDGPVTSELSLWNLGSTAPVDGLVAALTLGQNKNFRPQAFLTATDPRSPVNFVLLDYRNDFNENS